MVVVMKIDARDATEMIRNINKNLPKSINKGIKELAQLGVDNLKTQAYNAGINLWSRGRERSIFRGGTHKRRIKPAHYIVIMSKHGVYLDSMSPHWVALKRGRDITRWALDKGLAVSRGRGFRPMVTIYPVGLTKIFVRPHPFIQTAFLKTVKGMKIVKRRIKRNIRSKGRVI